MFAIQEKLNRRAKLAALAVLGLMLGGCGGDMSDLQEYADQIKSRPGRTPEKLPEIKPYETFTYVADTQGLRSPFRPDVPSAASGGGSGGGVRPDDDRSREFLEQFPLDSFAMVGTLSMRGNDYGLLRGRDGLVHRVVPGNYLGQNDGKITLVTESEIRLVEIVSDGIGGYLEREAAIGLED